MTSTPTTIHALADNEGLIVALGTEADMERDLAHYYPEPDSRATVEPVKADASIGDELYAMTFAERLADATAAADAVCPDPRTITDRVRAFSALTWPVDIRGQQRFFSRVLPTAEAEFEQALRDEFTLTELQRLRDFLAGLDLDDDETDD